MRRHLLHLAVFLTVVTQPAWGDTVTLLPASEDGQEYTLQGTITDFRGDAILFQRATGGAKSYPASRVVRIDTTWRPAHEAGRELLEQKSWQKAAQQLTTAGREERRTWARRIILSELLRCRLALGQWKPAGDLLLAIDASDPQTPAWSLAPLPWFAADGVTPAEARAWLARPEPAARLLGAAWLLATNERAAAEAELRSLTRSDRTQIARLAEAQLWRVALLRADARQVDNWGRRVDSLPAPLRAGPQHLLAQAYLRQKRYDKAALAALQAPLSGESHHRLAARGLLLAARSLRAAGREQEAQTLLNEILNDYQDTPQSRDAKALLQNQN